MVSAANELWFLCIAQILDKKWGLGGVRLVIVVSIM
jgi:hypothetical protein